MLIRPMTNDPDDLSFQRAMLMEAAYWRGNAERPPIEEALSDPELAKLVADWGRHGDAGCIAEDATGEPVGACWYRLWTDDHHSWGYVDPHTPELAIGVVAHCRGQGIGGALLEALLAHAHHAEIKRLSLSVEKDNPAHHLYTRVGFAPVGEVENAWTMVATTEPTD